MVELRIEIDGDVDKPTIDRAMTILGELVINKVKANIRTIDLIQKGDFLQGWFSKWTGNTLFIENMRKYALYLEYGTYAYFDIYGEDSYTEPVHPKKRDMSPQMKRSFPRGMQPFAPVRRVLYNDAIMEGLIDQAFKAAV